MPLKPELNLTWTLISLTLVVVLIGLWLYLAPSFLLGLLPSPKFETIVLAGSKSSGLIVDLGGGSFNDGKLTELLIQSVSVDGHWDRPENITIRNGKLRGSIRIMGLGRNGQAAPVRSSSHRKGHTERAQAAAPRRITLENLFLEANHRIPLYVAPGVTEVTVRNCTFAGWSVATAIYLCAESAGNAITGNTFTTEVNREVIAVDGSARNRIEGNRFAWIPFGGVYLYRNCGEGGTVRHQSPRENLISGNTFLACPRWGNYAVWLGSRGLWSPYCGQDAGHGFGSSADDRSFANDNTVSANSFPEHCSRKIRDDGKNNRIDN